MLIENSGYPEEDSLVLATVTKVNPNSVFCVLDHFGNRTGLIHISEISPGRIRNIRDYVVEGRKVVCKILRVDEEKGHIDLSLRRVTEIQKRNFLNDIKQEQKAEKLLAAFSKENNISAADMNLILKDIRKEYEFVFHFFKDIVDDNVKVNDVVKKHAKVFGDYIKDKIKPEQVEIKGELKICLFDPDGVIQLRKILKDVEDTNTIIKYMGAGNYTIIITEADYKPAERILKEKIDKLQRYVEDKKGVFEFKRKE